jgi:hypothetical protein
MGREAKMPVNPKPYRGTSLIKNTHPHRITICPYA